MEITIISGTTREGRKSHRVALGLEKILQEKSINNSLIDVKTLNLSVFQERLDFMEERPEELTQIAKQLQQSNALIFVTPEYNGGMASSLKHFIDLFSKAEYKGKPIGIATVSSGAMGGMRAAQQLQLQILALNAYPQPEMLLVGEVQNKFDESGVVTDETFKIKVDKYLNALINFTSKFE